MAEAVEVPVYLFTGFLEAGKTTFIQETLADPRFNAGESTLVLLCEEGEVELDLDALKGDITVEVIEDEDLLNPVNLQMLLTKAGAERVMVEYNGMWMLDTLFAAMPENWVVYQEFSFYDTDTFISYNTNMRQLVYNKLQTADCVVFNRFSSSADKMELHKIVRGCSRRAEIIYEYPDGETEYDDIEDPLPFDLEAPIVQIEDMDYAIWYRDMGEEMDKYQDKVVRVKGITGNAVGLLGGSFIIGREVMTCCVEDIRMAGLVCEWNGPRPQKGSWIWVTASINIQKHKAYGMKKGPVLKVKKIENAEEPDQTVATFY
ncbi:MAG: GTPase [Firmicutes bacterium]|nr:GTPase [Bacillota bacterium]MBQ2456350.1 GTPase [Bacillota bacterium]MBQ4181236.1 GTPase [Bacillota bacterium]MBQ4235020.1 GTPase [Bacillota bacterium]MBQ6014523.1 GTPase [Bacillota bacterium]